MSGRRIGLGVWMFASWHVLQLRDEHTESPWTPSDAQYWQAGTSAGSRIAPASPDGRCWSFLGTWADEADAVAAEEMLSSVPAVTEAWHVHLEALAGHGNAPFVGGSSPFSALPRTAASAGPAAIFTQALVVTEPDNLATFFGAAFGPMEEQLKADPACLARSNQRTAGVEGLCACTFTVWENLRAATSWAYAQGKHPEMVARSKIETMMTASGFWRFAVSSSRGTWGGEDPLRRLLPLAVQDSGA